MQPKVQILLATYNGEAFLPQQLDSLLNQTYTNFTILVRDDGSTDATNVILTKYVNRFPNKIEIIADALKNVGTVNNFEILLQKSKAPYIAFADQDDIWLPNKIEISLQKIITLEQANKATPCMVFSDLNWIDDQNNIINKSVWNALHLHPNYFTLNRLLIQNIPHGNTILINQAMKNMVLPFTETIIMHDHWIALVAATVGKWTHIEEPTVQLRFHQKNVTQIKQTFSSRVKRFSTNFSNKNQFEYFIELRVTQAKELYNRFHTKLNTEQQNILQQFFLLNETKGISRKWLFIKNHFFRTTFRHTIKMILRA